MKNYPSSPNGWIENHFKVIEMFVHWIWTRNHRE
jgi:hypothetical protein